MQVHFPPRVSRYQPALFRQFLQLVAACLLCINVLALPAHAQTGGVSSQEYNALVAIYNATGGSNWFINDNWLSTEPVSTWYGVTVDSTGKVTALDLPFNNLVGNIPAQAATLKFLTDLQLSNNELTKINALPASLVTLGCNTNLLTALPALPGKLRVLDCGSNKITKLPTLPASLTTLASDNNRLTALPTLPAALTSLSAAGNQLYVLPKLPNGLSTIEVSNNQIYLLSVSKLPDSLAFLSVSNNKLYFLPTLPKKLAFLNASFNQLSFLPKFPAALETVLIDNNRLTFEDLEPIDSLLFVPEQYAPQANVGKKETRSVRQGGTIRLSAFAGNTPNNRYVWLKDSVAVTDTLTTPYYTITNAAADDAGVYTCQITNTVVTGLTIFRNPITVKVTTATAREGVAAETDIAVYPNPFTSSVQLRGSAFDKEVAISVVDVQGRIVYSAPAHAVAQPIQLNENLPSGLYILRVTDSHQAKTFRLVKSR